MPAGTRAGGAIPGPTVDPLQTAAAGAVGTEAAAGMATRVAARRTRTAERPFTTKGNSVARPWLRRSVRLDLNQISIPAVGDAAENEAPEPPRVPGGRALSIESQQTPDTMHASTVGRR